MSPVTKHFYFIVSLWSLRQSLFIGFYFFRTLPAPFYCAAHAIYCSSKSVSAKGSIVVLTRLVAVFIIVSLYELRSIRGNALVCISLYKCVWIYVCVCHYVPQANKLWWIPEDPGLRQSVGLLAPFSRFTLSSEFSARVKGCPHQSCAAVHLNS